MADHVPYRVIGTVNIDDPREVARINKLEAEADLELERRKQGPKKRKPTGGRKIYFWADGQLQEQLESLNPGSPGVAAKRIVQEFFVKSSSSQRC
jgi:hypothetical protein